MKKILLKIPKTGININTATEGETIEMKMERITENNEPIKDGSPTYFTERSEGVKPEFNIRTDRWEIAADAMDKKSKSDLAKRQKALEEKTEKERPTEPKVEGGETPVNSTTSPQN